MKKGFIGILLILQSIALFLFEESWIIAVSAIFNIIISIILVTLVLLTPCIIVMFIADGHLQLKSKWIEKTFKEGQNRYHKAINYLFWISVLSTSIIISPSVAAIMIHLKGVRGTKALMLNFISSLICSTIWVLIYSGAIQLIKHIII